MPSDYTLNQEQISRQHCFIKLREMNLKGQKDMLYLKTKMIVIWKKYPKTHFDNVNFLFRSLLSLLLLCGGQSAYPQRFRGELTAGVAGSQISGDQLSGFNKAGVMAGVGIRTYLSTKTETGFRMMYFQKGSRKRLRNDEPDSSYYLLRLNYIEIPWTFSYKVRNHLLIEAGPSLGYLINSYEEDENGELFFRRPFHNFDVSLTGSLVYELGDGLNFLFSYWQSLLPVREHESMGTFRLNKGQYSSVMSFSFVYVLKRRNPDTENSDLNP